jgi:5-methylcytosine-specific restriction endonuclease McrA
MAKRSNDHLRAQKEGKERDGNTCQICGGSHNARGHHIIDVQFGGSSDKDNIVTLCDDHHKNVHAKKISIIKF